MNNAATVMNNVAVTRLLLEHAHHRQVGSVGQLVEVLAKGHQGAVVGDFALKQVALEGPEYLGLVVTQLGLDPVFRVEEYLAVCFPHAVRLHPLPPLGIDGSRTDPWIRVCRWLQIQQAALDEELYRRDRLLDTGG